jgi:hypothetical protein
MSYTPKYFTKYGLEFAYFNKYLLYEEKEEDKVNIMNTVYQTIYSKHFKLDKNLAESVNSKQSNEQEIKQGKEDKQTTQKQLEKDNELQQKSVKA